MSRGAPSCGGAQTCRAGARVRGLGLGALAVRVGVGVWVAAAEALTRWGEQGDHLRLGLGEAPPTKGGMRHCSEAGAIHAQGAPASYDNPDHKRVSRWSGPTQSGAKVIPSASHSSLVKNPRSWLPTCFCRAAA